MFLSTLNNHNSNPMLSLSYWFVAWTMVPDFPMMVEEVGRVQWRRGNFESYTSVIKMCHLCLYTTALNTSLA